MSVTIYLKTVNPRFSGPAKWPTPSPWKIEESPLLEDHGSSLEQDKPLTRQRLPYHNGLPPSSSWLHHSLGPAGPAKRGVIIPNVPGDRANTHVCRSWKDVWVLRVLVMGVAYKAGGGRAADTRTSSHDSKLTPWQRPGSHRCWGRGPLRSLEEQWTTLSDSRTGTEVFGRKDQKV